MEDWKEIIVGSSADILAGYAFDSKQFVDKSKGIPLVRIRDLKRGYTEVNYAGKFQDRYIIEKDDVLIGMDGDFHVVRWKGIRALLNQRVLKVTAKGGLDNNLLYYFLVGELIKIQNQTTGTTVKHLSNSDVAEIRINIPNGITEQSTIANILTKIDQTIEKTEQLIAKYECIKTGLMQDLLTRGIDEHGNIRSEETHEFKDSPLGRIPREWEVKTIGQITEYVGSGVTPRGGSSVYQSSGVILIRSQNVLTGEMSLNEVAYISESINNSMLRSEIFENDVLLNITGASIGRSCVVPYNFPRANVNQHVCSLRLFNKNEANASFLSTFLNSYWGQSQISRNNAGSNREGLNYTQIKAIELPFPNTDDEFKRIFKVLDTIERTLKTSKTENAKLNSQKIALMQDLLTGRVRVDGLLGTKTI